MAKNDSQKKSEDIDKMLREAAKRSLTREEIRAQRVSFTMGMMSDKSTMSRRQVEELVDERYG
jgi:hypothetical protein